MVGVCSERLRASACRGFCWSQREGDRSGDGAVYVARMESWQCLHERARQAAAGEDACDRQTFWRASSRRRWRVLRGFFSAMTPTTPYDLQTIHGQLVVL